MKNNQKILISILSLSLFMTLNAYVMNYEEGDTTILPGGTLYNIKSMDGEYNRPTSNDTDKDVFRKAWKIIDFENTDFENDLDKWDKKRKSTNDDEDNIISSNKSDVKGNDSNYLYNIDSEKGFNLTQLLNIKDKFTKYLYKLKIELDYNGYEKIDKTNFNISSYDNKDDVDNNDDNFHYTSSSLRGYKDDDWKKYIKLQSWDEYKSEYIKINIETTKYSDEDDESPVDTDAYIDNIKISAIENKFYASNENEKITYEPDEHYFTIKTYALDGNDYIIPSNKELYEEAGRIYSGEGKDYVVMEHGQNNVVYDKGEDDDVIIGYQGDLLSVATYIYSIGGDDKVYSPSNGTDHWLIGGNGWDTLVLRGKRDDYTFTHVDDEDKDYITIAGPNDYSATMYEFESVSFTSENVLSSVDGNTTEEEQLYVFKDNGDDTLSLINDPENLDEKVDEKTVSDYVGILSAREIEISIDTDIETDDNEDIKIFIQYLPDEITKVTDVNGDEFNVRVKTNEDNEINNSVIIYIHDKSDISEIKFITKKVRENVEIDLSNIKINRAFTF